MSEISKARQRMLRHVHTEQQQSEHESRHPRKFTVSSLTHHFQRSEPHQTRPISPGASQVTYERSEKEEGSERQFGTIVVTPSKNIYGNYQTSRSHTPDQRSSTPLLKTIHLKINQIHELNPSSDSLNQTNQSQMSRVSLSSQKLYPAHTTRNNDRIRAYREQEEDQYELTSRLKELEHRQMRERGEVQQSKLQGSRFQESPAKANRRPLHTELPQLLIAPQPERRHHSPYKPRETLKAHVDQVLSSTRGQPFTDDFFPPAHSIVFNRRILYQQQGLKFERLSQIYSTSSSAPCLLHACQPTMLTLGKYTNPYLYSALSILAEHPLRIMALFNNQQYNDSGVYHLNLCKDGVWRYIVVDDYMPVKSIAGRKQMLFMHSKEDIQQGRVEVWSALVEKAVAKIYGTYLDLAMGREVGMGQLFRLMTGAPMVSYPLNKDFRSFLILIDSALKRGHIVTLQALREEHQQTGQHLSISPHQAYRVLSIKKSGLKLRNYSQPQLFTKLTFSQCLLFQRLIIYRLQQNYRYVTYKLRHKKGCYSNLKLKVGTATRGYFDVWQNNPAYYKKHLGSNIEYAVGRVRMRLTPWSDHQQEQDGEEKGNEGQLLQVGKEVALEQGWYELRVHLCQEKEYDFTVSYYGQKDIQMERVKVQPGHRWSQPCLCIGDAKAANRR